MIKMVLKKPVKDAICNMNEKFSQKYESQLLKTVINT
jgi:hypothetical protein